MTSSEPEPEPHPQPDLPPIPIRAGGLAEALDGPAPRSYREAHAPLGEQLAWPALVAGMMLGWREVECAIDGPWNGSVDPPLSVAAGALVIGSAAWTIRAALRRARAVPSARWLGDHPWRRNGGASRVLSPMRQLALAVTALIAVGAAAVTLLAGGGKLAVIVVTAIFSIPFVLSVAFAVRPLLIGGVAVEWKEFPLLTGRRHDVRLRPTSRLLRGRLHLARLRLVWSPPPTDGGLREPPIVADTFPWARLMEQQRADGSVELTLDLERATATTQLHPNCSLHWELVVTGDTKVGPIAATILLPIYADPAAAARLDDREAPATGSGSAAPPNPGGGADASHG